MTAFVRRYRTVPSIATLTAIEQIALVDQTPTTPVVGAGAGCMLLVGEFEDGEFNEPTEVLGPDDEAAKFGGFGYTYGSLKYQNPCARIHNGEVWNGNGFIKGKYLQPPRKVIVRVDSSVGSVRFQPLASIRSAIGPFRFLVGQQLSFAPDGGGAVLTAAINATAATVNGIAFPGGGNLSLFVGGEQISITVDDNPAVIVTFQAADQTAAQVAARINSFLGYAAAVTILAGTGISLTGITLGTAGRMTRADVSAGALAAIGHVAATTNGAGNVANLNSVTATELAGLVDALAGVVATVDSTGAVVAYSATVGTGSLLLAAGAMATAAGFTPIGSTVSATVGAAAIIPAGTRVRTAGGAEWVSMQTLSIPEGTSSAPNLAYYTSPIRPGNDNGTAGASVAGTIVVLVDIPAGRMFSVTNVDNVSAALDENTLDARYQTAFDSTTDPSLVSAEVNFSLCARRTAAVSMTGRNNAITASNEGCQGRVFHARAAFGVPLATAQADRATLAAGTGEADRVFFAYPGWRMRVPEIAEIGLTGGTGFTADGIITIGGDGPLAYINAALNPEENPGQNTGLLSFLVDVERITGVFLNMAFYIAAKATGICAPKVDKGVFCYQSEATASLTAGLTTQKRRKMADHIADSVALILAPFSKLLITEGKEAAIDSRLDSFLGGYKSVNKRDAARIDDYAVANTTDANPDLADRGVSSRSVQVKLLRSYDTFLVTMQIGEGQVITTVT